LGRFPRLYAKKFVPANHEEIIRNKVKQLKQITNVKEYYVEFRKLTIQSSEMNDGEKRHCFLDGLRHEVAKWVRLREPKTIEEAYEKAVLFETFETDDKSRTSFMASNNRSKGNANRNNNRNHQIRNQQFNNNNHNNSNNNSCYNQLNNNNNSNNNHLNNSNSNYNSFNQR
jgi:hypothetical protein